MLLAKEGHCKVMEESFRLEKSSQIVASTTKPCPSAPHLYELLNTSRDGDSTTSRAVCSMA